MVYTSRQVFLGSEVKEMKMDLKNVALMRVAGNIYRHLVEKPGKATALKKIVKETGEQC